MSTTYLTHLEWFRCLDGYHVEDRKDPPGRRARLIPGIAGRYIVRNSTRWEPTTPLRVDGLYQQLADVKGDEGALEFVTRHGYLSRAKSKDSRLDDVLGAATGMRGLVDAIKQTRWAAIADTLNREGQDSIFEFGGIGRLGAVFEWREGMERPELFYRPGSLLSALYLQALQDASGGAELQKCDRPGCPRYFQVGPGTGRPRLNRGVAYCNPTCQKAHAYMKKKGVSK